MLTLHRVFPFLKNAADDEPGGALYTPSQGGGRLDNPDLYSVLYLSSAPAGAIAEAFGRFPEWIPALFEGSPSLPGSVRAIARYRVEAPATVCDLDDSHQLQMQGLRPSDIVSRDYRRTREWARQIFLQKKWRGVRWWSYYDPKWGSLGLWDLSQFTVEEVRELQSDDPAVLEASQTIARRIVRPRS